MAASVPRIAQVITAIGFLFGFVVTYQTRERIVLEIAILRTLADVHEIVEQIVFVRGRLIRRTSQAQTGTSRLVQSNHPPQSINLLPSLLARLIGDDREVAVKVCGHAGGVSVVVIAARHGDLSYPPEVVESAGSPEAVRIDSCAETAGIVGIAGAISAAHIVVFNILRNVAVG